MRPRLLNERDREVLALAVPAFATLLAEPVFLLADSAIVGHVGTLPLAGLGLAPAVLSTVVAGDLPGVRHDGRHRTSSGRR